MIAIADYDAGNIASVEKALKYLGEECIITGNPLEIEKADRLIVPGVGAFGDAMGRFSSPQERIANPARRRSAAGREV